MRRRDFLKLVSAAVAASSVGLSGKKYNIRFIEAFDVYQNAMVRRIDVSQLPLMDVSKYGPRTIRFDSISRSQLFDVWSRIRKFEPSVPPREVLELTLFRPLLAKDEIRSMSWVA